MARRKLLGEEQWATLFALPAGERDVVRHCAVPPDLMGHITPLGWEHISLTGDYVGPLTPSLGPACTERCASGRRC